MRFTDVVSLREVKRQADRNGFVRVPAIITTVGIQQYRADQLGVAGVSGNQLVNVFRGPDTVFHADTIESFRHLPVTDGHPAAGVKPTNAKFVQGGHVGEDVQKTDESSLGATLYLTDEGFISSSRGSETSAGYDANIIKADGEFEGTKYQYKFDGAMLGNHLALVAKGRCGHGNRVLDENHNKENTMEKDDVVQIVADAIAKNNETQAASTATIVADALVAHQTIQDKKVADAADLLKTDADDKQKLEDQKVVDQAAIATRVDLLTKVKPLLGDKYDAKLDNKELLVLTLGDSVDDAAEKSEDYLMALLDAETGKRKGVVGAGLKMDALGGQIGAIKPRKLGSKRR
jgi:hypothetical protein